MKIRNEAELTAECRLRLKCFHNAALESGRRHARAREDSVPHTFGFCALFANPVSMD